jgi:hypothetical protein
MPRAWLFEAWTLTLALASGACSSSAGTPRDAGTESAADRGAESAADRGADTPVVGDLQLPLHFACEVALDDSQDPCPATLSQAETTDAGRLTTACGSLEHLIPPSADVFFGSWDCFYDGVSGALVGWDMSSDIPQFCGNTAPGAFAGNVPSGCATFLDQPYWRRVHTDGGAGDAGDAAAVD